MTGTIYMAVNTVNGKAYVGQALDFDERRIEHLRDARRGGRYHFQNALRKYGEDAFGWRVLASGVPQSQLDTQERFWIRFYQTRSEEGMGYNHTSGGMAGLKSPETKAKISATKTGVKREPFSAEWRAKMSQAQRGRKHSPETRAKIGAGRRGKKHSEHAKMKMRGPRRMRRQIEAGQQFLSLEV